jgi:5'-nucleotidase
MKTLFIDMDGVIVDFMQSVKNHPEFEKYKNEIDALPDVFLNALPMEHAIDSVGKLLDCGKYEVYIASTAPWGNIDSLSHKRIWIEKYFGDRLKKRLILTHRKDFLMGDYLIDDRLKNGAGEFKGELLHFGTTKYPDWKSVLEYLL